jgi:hypothetical protein
MGHGSYRAAWYFFPYTMWLAVLSGTIRLTGIVLAFVQFPVCLLA